MSWKGDERLYQPRIHSQRIRELHRIAEQSDIPMTVLVDIILRKFVENTTTTPLSGVSSENPAFEPKH